MYFWKKEKEMIEVRLDESHKSENRMKKEVKNWRLFQQKKAPFGKDA